ncbi:1-aminocyclopropane-1-carboxylate deaminase/D-cysteine desulfhydrase [Aquimarina agarilytica]|uniref:1-aminocyclopropane-1-carboxylate deaminase/D-cysteine desulfhydrase n=1 Tax=Aquimarina agarilytica TaxID=1087449 RepID=UPI000288CDBF|nr:pyridoxal-phosphate dependent enzyme [Aquimarina agarilytica]
MITTVKNDQILHPLLEQYQIELFIKREDLLHPHISGNKFRKLKYNTAKAKQQNKQTLLTFGGAYSNHIVATACAGNLYGFKTIGIIRGEELGVDLSKTLAQNNTLAFAVKQGMQLHFISRSEYKLKEKATFITGLQKRFGDFYLVPEGGTNELAIQGCTEILTPNDHSFDVICCAVGTGGTITGLIRSAQPEQHVIGFPALKETYLHKEISKKTTQTNWELNRNYHLGGYAKTTPELISFINEFYKTQKILLDPIYTGKLLHGIFESIKQGNFRKKTRILAIHTGGLQGIAGINTKLKKKGQKLITTNYEI